MSDETCGRRALLAGVGAVGLGALAGCGGLNPVGGDDTEPTVETASFDGFGGDVPDVEGALPVAVADDYLDDAAASARADLDGVPHPLTADDVPNGAIRSELAGHYADATDALDRATEAATDRAALDALRDARTDARWARAAWAAIDDGTTRADVRSGADGVAADVRAFRERWRYVGGSDAVRALVVHGELEDRVATARTSLRALRADDDSAGTSPPAVGEAASTVEGARVAAADAAHLYERFRDSLSETLEYAAAFDAAESTLADAAAERASALPDAERGTGLVEADVEGTAVGAALGELHFAVDGDAGYYREMGRVAGAIRHHHSRLTGLRALDALRSAVADGDYPTVESADDVREIRADAVDAVAAAREGATHPRLDSLVLEWLPDAVRRSDDELARYDDPVPVSYVTREVGRYVRVARTAAAVSAASETVAEALAR